MGGLVRLRWSRKAALVSLLFNLVLPTTAAAVTTLEKSYGNRLEAALNQGDAAALSDLVDPGLQERLQRRYDRFAAGFPGARWNVDQLEPLADGRSRLRVSVKGVGRSGGLLYRMHASQTLAVSVQAGVMQEEELLDDRSLLRSGRARLPIIVQLPRAVLTGSRYDIDVMVDEPLGQAMLAGGLTQLDDEAVRGSTQPGIQLEPLGGGGLYKRVQAPQTPGVQTWAVMLVHPDGVVTATQRVRVASDEAEMARY